MHRVLYILSVLAMLMGAYALSQAPTITQQATGFIVLLIAAVLFSGAAIVQAVLSLMPGAEKLSAEELHEKQVRELAASWTAPAPATAASNPEAR